MHVVVLRCLQSLIKMNVMLSMGILYFFKQVEGEKVKRQTHLLKSYKRHMLMLLLLMTA